MSDVIINEPVKPPWFRDIRVIRVVAQVLVLLSVIAFLFWLVDNAVTNLTEAGRDTSFDFLQRDFGSAVPGRTDAADGTILNAFFIGYGNTVRVILVGIPACTVLGILIGIARLSENAAVRTAGTLYVEVFRNVPILIWIFFAYSVVLVQNLPTIDEAPDLPGVILSNRGIAVPWLNPDSSASGFLAVIGFGLIAAVLISSWRKRVNEQTGEPARGGLFGIIGFLVVLAIGNFVVGNALKLDQPIVDGRSIAGGMSVFVPYAGLTIALTLYTASHVAEVVRGGIQAVAKGQSEAANAIALTAFQRYRFIILPQAFRIMIPPLASQYLNITKNSSLGVAISYVEITSIAGRVQNNAAPAPQVILVIMGLYLTFSLSISLVANFFNRRLELDAR